MEIKADNRNAQQIAYWNDSAGLRWAAGQDQIDRMLASAQQALLKAAHPKPGERIADIGCGCGTTALALAAAEPSTAVLGIDISKPMLERARALAGQRELANLDFLEADASVHAFEPKSLDLIVSRFGVMFFDDPASAFVNLRRALKRQGRLAFVCWREPRQNEWVSIPVSAVRPHVPPQTPLGPFDPGPFAFADMIRIRSYLDEAGFDAITIRPLDGTASFGATPAEATAYLSDVGPVSRLLADASPVERERATEALRAALTLQLRDGQVVLGLAQWLVTARNP